MHALLSDSPATMAGAIKQTINEDVHSVHKAKARKGVDYYNYKHDILNNRIFYVDNNGDLREDKYASNIRIPHSFLTQLIKQKTQFLLSNPLVVETEDETLKERLAEYYNDDFQVFLQELVEGGSQKGFEYAYARTTSEDKLAFQVADALNVVPIYDDDNVVRRVLYHYHRDVYKDGRTTKVHYAELYDDKQVWYFTATGSANYMLDTSRDLNPKPHVTAIADNDGETQVLGRSYGLIPFYRYANNSAERTDLEPIKDAIDDYDLMNAFLSNNLQDFAEAIYVVSGYQGDDLDKLRQNIKARKTLGVGQNGGLEIKTVDVPYEARKAKLDIDRENIYMFGMGFDSSLVGDGNVTNVVILGRYTLLNMKANETEVRLRAALKWINQLVIDDINRRYGTAYKPSDVTFEIERDLLVNQSDIANVAKTEADKRAVDMQTLLSVAPMLDDESVLREICDAFELDYDEVRKRLDEQAEEEPATVEVVANEENTEAIATTEE